MPRLMIFANSAWNLAHFRGNLIRALAGRGYELIGLCPEADLMASDYPDLPMRRLTIRMERSGLDPLKDLRVIRDAGQLMREVRPDAVLSFTIKPNIYGCIAARRQNIPAIPNVSGLGTAFASSRGLRTLVEQLYRSAFRKASAVFFQNAEDLELFVNRGLVRSSQTVLVPGSGVDLKRFSPRPLPEGQTRFLLIGRLLRDKGVYHFVEAARAIRRTNPGTRFQLLGPIDDHNRTAVARADVDSWVAEGIVEYLGTTHDVRPFIEQASVVVLPSYHEGMPRTLLEAAATARPLVASDIPGCRDIVHHGVTGLLCNPRSTRALEEAMREMVAMTHEQRAETGRAARALAERDFNEQIVIDAYIAMLDRILALPS